MQDLAHVHICCAVLFGPGKHELQICQLIAAVVQLWARQVMVRVELHTCSFITVYGIPGGL